MSLLTASNLGLSFGAFDLFKGVSGTIANDSKIGLIGPNGVGKTSLMLILAGISQPTTGQVYLAKGRRLGYLRQEAVDAFANRRNTVYDEMTTVFADLQAQQARLHTLEAEMAAGNHSDEVMQQYGKLQEAFAHAGGYEYENLIQRTLEGLGLGRKHWQMPLQHLSGGQKTRALLARLLLEQPDLLMLDEPTNHLDIEAVEWLENTLREWQGAVLITSHDRYFLDGTVNTIWEMTPVGIQVYAGNYSAYLQQRFQRWEYYERTFKEEKERLLKEVDYIQRNWVRASTHAQALGRLRRLTRDLSIIEHHGIMALRSGRKWSEYDYDTIRGTERPLSVTEAIRQVNAIQMTSNRPMVVRPRLKEAHSSGTIVLRAKHVTIGYPNNSLFSIQGVELLRGECAAILGPNGSGKTTFLKVLLGQMEPLKGRVQLGASLKIGYFAQAHDSLTGSHSVIEEMLQHKEMESGQARSYLAQYLFRSDDVFKPLDALSGGERARLALAIMALDGANFLLLDEPTNHLDIPSREALQEVLESFTGTILLVSHDRYLIDRLASQIWEIRDGKLLVFKGTYREFILRQTAPGAASHTRQIVLKARPMARDNSQETRRKQQTLTMLEERIRQHEEEVKHLSAEMEKASRANTAGGKNAFEHLQRLGLQVAQAQASLEALLTEWERLAE